MKICVAFENFGPYHVARLSALSKFCDLLALEAARRSNTYGWEVASDVPFRRITLADSSISPLSETRRATERALDTFRPDAVAIPGWLDPVALTMLIWASSRQVAVIVMSESQESDSARRAPLEWAKSRIIRNADAALVGGSRHRTYLAKLGLQPDRSLDGYDVVDNAYFANGARSALGEKLGLLEANFPARFLLASARFVPEKNLRTLLHAFALYRKLAIDRGTFEPWDLVLLGDGPQRSLIEAEVRLHGLEKQVKLPGFVQYPALPAYFGRAEAFVHASTVEPWGLVVNEAMAAGLPVIVSDRCGCAPDLVQPGENGLLFDPENPAALAEAILQLEQLGPETRSAMGEASRSRIARYSPELFAASLLELAKTALAGPRKRMGIIDRLLIETLLRPEVRARLNGA